MCRPSSIQLQVTILVYIKAAIALYIVITGFSIASDVNINQAFGTEFRGYGTGLIWMGMFSGVAIIPHKWATMKHNRFALFLVFIIDTIVLCIQLSIGLQIASYISPIYPKELQLDCLLNTPLIYSHDKECQDYFKSDRLAGMYLYWKYWYTRKADPVAFQKITLLEGDNCCGFFPPFKCDFAQNSNAFPANRDITGVDTALTSQRVSCGKYPNFYPEQTDCGDFYDIVAGIVGGCNYDHGLGFCLKRELTSESRGCASNVEDALVAIITPTAYFVMGSIIFNLFAMLLCCCLWWKRKAVDVFPDIGVTNAKEVNWADVRDQFEVKPQHNVLVKKGFLPEQDKLKLKYIEQMVKEETSFHMSAKQPVSEEGKVPDDEGPLPPEVDVAPTTPSSPAGKV